MKLKVINSFIRRVILLMCTAMILSVSGCSHTPAAGLTVNENSSANSWTAGFSEKDLICDDPSATTYYLAGYRTGNVADGVLDYQKAKAMWLECGSCKIMLIVIDCVGLSRTDINLIRESLSDFKRESGCTFISVTSTHTHAGIDTLGLWGPDGTTGKNTEFMKTVTEGAKQAALEAYESRTEGKIYYSELDSGESVAHDGIQRDSRPPYVYDKLIHSIRFVPNDSEKSGIRIMNYGAHPESLRSENSSISADFPAYISEIVKETTGEDFIYIPAAIGGLISTHTFNDENGNNLSPVENVKKTAEVLAEILLSESAYETEIRPYLSIASEVIDIPLYNQLFAAMSFIGTLSTEAIGDFEASPLKTGVRTEVSVMKLGDMNILMIPGELFPELAYGGFLEEKNTNIDNPVPLLELVGADEKTLIFGLTGDEIGYIIPPSDFVVHEKFPYIERGVDSSGRSHYEETNSTGIETAVKIAESIERLIKVIK